MSEYKSSSQEDSGPNLLVDKIGVHNDVQRPDPEVVEKEKSLGRRWWHNHGISRLEKKM